MALFLRESDVAELLTMGETIDAVETAFRDVAEGKGSALPRRRLRVRGGVLHVMSGVVPALGVFGVKAYTTTREGARFALLIFDTRSGQLVGILEADKLGQLRTGAASAVATKHMARPDAQTLGIYGTGWQARGQVEAACAVRPISLVRCYSRSPERRERFARDLAESLHVRVEPVEAPEAVCRGAAVVVTATTSAEPVVRGEWLEPGTHLNVVGSNSSIKREIDDDTVRRASLVVADDRGAAKIEGGDLIVAVEKGLLNWNGVHELGDVVVGRVPGRPSDDAITIFKSHGSGIEDAAAAAVVLRKARERGLGNEVPMFAEVPPSRAAR